MKFTINFSKSKNKKKGSMKKSISTLEKSKKWSKKCKGNCMKYKLKK